MPGLRIPGPILPVEEDAFADGLDKRHLHGGPVNRTRDLCGLVIERNKYPRMTPGRRKNWLGLTWGEVFEGVLIFPLFTISHNAESTSAPSSRSPSKKLSIFLLRAVSVVEPSVQIDASWLMHRLLISSYLCLSVSTWSTLVM